jgi:hypothetical protein
MWLGRLAFLRLGLIFLMLLLPTPGESGERAITALGLGMWARGLWWEMKREMRRWE